MSPRPPFLLLPIKKSSLTLLNFPPYSTLSAQSIFYKSSREQHGILMKLCIFQKISIKSLQNIVSQWRCFDLYLLSLPELILTSQQLCSLLWTILLVDDDWYINKNLRMIKTQKHNCVWASWDESWLRKSLYFSFHGQNWWFGVFKRQVEEFYASVEAKSRNCSICSESRKHLRNFSFELDWAENGEHHAKCHLKRVLLQSWDSKVHQRPAQVAKCSHMNMTTPGPRYFFLQQSGALQKSYSTAIILRLRFNFLVISSLSSFQ